MKISHAVVGALAMALAVLASSLRSFHLTPAHAGACFVLDQVTNDTYLDFELKTPYVSDIPILVLNYFERKEWTQLPNLDEFYDEDYIRGSHNRLVKYDDSGNVVFRQGMPEDWESFMLESLYKWNVLKPLVYCAYVPKVNSTAPFLVEVTFHNEPSMVDAPIHAQYHAAQVATSLLVLLLLWFFGSPRSFTPVLIANGLVLGVLLLGELAILNLPTYTLLLRKMYSLIVYPLENNEGNLLIEVLPLAVVTAYLGSLFGALFSVLIYLLAWLCRPVLLSRVLALSQEFNLKPIVLGGRPWDVLYSLIVTGADSARDAKMYLSSPLETSGAIFLFYFVICLSAIQIGLVFLGSLGLWNARKQESSSHQWRRMFTWTVLGYFFVWDSIIKKGINMLPFFNGPVVYEGVADFAEALLVLTQVLTDKMIKSMLLDLVGVFLLWLIWRRAIPKKEKAVKNLPKKAKEYKVAVESKSLALADGKGTVEKKKKKM